jgi:hypothetical protein
MRQTRKISTSDPMSFDPYTPFEPHNYPFFYSREL